MHLQLMRSIFKMLSLQLNGRQVSMDDLTDKTKAKKGLMAQTIQKLNRENVYCNKNVEQMDKIVNLFVEMCRRFSN